MCREAQTSCPTRVRQRQVRQPGLAVLSPHAVSCVSTTCQQAAAAAAWTAALPAPGTGVRTVQAPVRAARVASVRQVAQASVPAASVHQDPPAASVHETVSAAPTRGGVPWGNQPVVRGSCPGVFCPSWPFSLPSYPVCRTPGPAVQKVARRSRARRVAADQAETDRVADRVALVHVVAGQAPVVAGEARRPVGRADATAYRQPASHR